MHKIEITVCPRGKEKVKGEQTINYCSPRVNRSFSCQATEFLPCCSQHCLIRSRVCFCPFSNLSITSPTSELIFQPFRRFTYVTAHSPTLTLLHLRHISFSNPYFASPTSQALHLIHLASRPFETQIK